MKLGVATGVPSRSRYILRGARAVAVKEIERLWLRMQRQYFEKQTATYFPFGAATFRLEPEPHQFKIFQAPHPWIPK